MGRWLPLLSAFLLAAARLHAVTFPWPVWTPGVTAVPPSATGLTYYVDGTGGNDSHDGKSLANAFKTVAKAVSVVAPGDTVLIRKGLYREGIYLSGAPSGTAAQPITFGSYGDGEVILDGSAKVTGWVRHAGNVWKANVTTFTPSAIVVNETPLKEVSHGQTGTAPAVGLPGVTSGSGRWFYDPATKTLYADMETTLGAGDPNGADIVVPNDDGAQQHVFFWDGRYYVFEGLTIRGGGSYGIWGTGDHIKVERCDLKFNGKGGVSFGGPPGAAGNSVLLCHIYHNVLVNWPRGNNDNTGGGWPAALDFYANDHPVARGNVVHRNGGEGIDAYGFEAGAPIGGALFEKNVAYDNWSVNVYIDNQPDAVIRNNLIFDHPADLNDLLYTGDAYWTEDVGRKLTPVGVMLADEEGQSDATNHYANLNGSKVYDNVIANCRVAIRDYAEGTNAIAWHGLKNTTIANNTILLPTYASPDYTAGIEVLDNKTPSGVERNVNSIVANNVVYGFGSGLVAISRQASGLAGVVFDRNVYFGAATASFGYGSPVTATNFAGWKAQLAGQDVSSLWQDPLLVDVSRFGATAAAVPVYDWTFAALTSSSPAKDMGVSLASLFANDFALVSRPQGMAWDAGAVEFLPCAAGDVAGPAVVAPTSVIVMQSLCP